MQSSCSDSLYSWEVTRSQCEAARYLTKVHVYKQLAQNETCGTSAAQEMTPVNMQSSLKGAFAHKCETLASEAQSTDSKRRYERILQWVWKGFVGKTNNTLKLALVLCEDRNLSLLNEIKWRNDKH